MVSLRWGALQMFYRVLADLVLILHFAFIVYAIFGGLLVLKWKWTIFLHIPVVAWGVLVEVFAWICPLTPLENEFRMAAGIADYSGSFVDQYLIPIVYPDNLTREVQWLLGIALLLINLVIYSMVLSSFKKR